MAIGHGNVWLSGSIWEKDYHFRVSLYGKSLLSHKDTMIYCWPVMFWRVQSKFILSLWNYMCEMIQAFVEILPIYRNMTTLIWHRNSWSLQNGIRILLWQESFVKNFWGKTVLVILWGTKEHVFDDMSCINLNDPCHMAIQKRQILCSAVI